MRLGVVGAESTHVDQVLRLARTRYADRYRRSLFGRRGMDEAVTEIEVSGVTVRWPPKRWSRPTTFEDI